MKVIILLFLVALAATPVYTENEFFKKLIENFIEQDPTIQKLIATDPKITKAAIQEVIKKIEEGAETGKKLYSGKDAWKKLIVEALAN